MDKLIETIVGAIEDKKGKNIVSLDLSGFDGAICSRFIVCNADSTTQVGAIAAGIEEKVLEVLGEKVWRIEGQQNAVWIAMDYVDVDKQETHDLRTQIDQNEDWSSFGLMQVPSIYELSLIHI